MMNKIYLVKKKEERRLLTVTEFINGQKKL